MTTPKNPKQKLYAYVDESGQDIKSSFFVVVAVVSDEEQDVPSRVEMGNPGRNEQLKTGASEWFVKL